MSSNSKRKLRTKTGREKEIEPPCPTCGGTRYKYGKRFAFLFRLYGDRHLNSAYDTEKAWERIRPRECIDCILYRATKDKPTREVRTIFPVKRKVAYLKRRRIWLRSGVVTIWKPTKLQLLRIAQAKKRAKKQLAKERMRRLRELEKKKRRREKKLARQKARGQE